jgi:TPP-dependent pyruvate/acetoin dehydrogenase alpha subunit
MLLQRAVDTRGFQLNRQGKIAIAMGSEGHEAVQAGTGLAFERGRDILFPYYRNTGLILACGFPLIDLFRSQFARATDRTRGRQIINHITAHELGIASISSIIAAQCTHAAGAAYALKMRRESIRRRCDERR